MPRVADRVDHGARGPFDRRNGLSHRSLGHGLAGLRVASVDQHGARRAEPGSAAELRAVQTEDVPEHPQQRGLLVAVVNLDLAAVDDKLHLGPPSNGTWGRSCTGRASDGDCRQPGQQGRLCPSIRSRVASLLSSALRWRAAVDPTSEQINLLVRPPQVAWHRSRIDGRQNAIGVRGHIIERPQIEGAEHRRSIGLSEQRLDVVRETWCGGRHVALLLYGSACPSEFRRDPDELPSPEDGDSRAMHGERHRGLDERERGLRTRPA